MCLMWAIDLSLCCSSHQLVEGSVTMISDLFWVFESSCLVCLWGVKNEELLLINCFASISRFTHSAKNTIHPVTTMLSATKNGLFPGHKLLTTGANHRCWWPSADTLVIAWAPVSEGSSAPMVSRWLRPGNRTLLEVDSMVVSWWIVFFALCVNLEIFACSPRSLNKRVTKWQGVLIT